MVTLRKHDARINSSNFWHLVDASGSAHLDDFRRELGPQLNGITNAKNLAKTDLLKIHLRKQQGLLVYESCGVDELRVFCKARGINSNHGYAFSMGVLEWADEKMKFDRFEDLPPELRMRIYEWHQAWLPLGPVGEFTRPPPIADVSKTIRQEALSVFFRERMFFIGQWNPRLGGKLGVQELTRDFFEKAPTTFLQCVKRLTIMGPIGVSTASVSASGYAEWTVDLGKRTRAERAEFVSMGTAEMRKYDTGAMRRRRISRKTLDARGKGAEESLREFVDEVMERKPVRFKQKDEGKILAALVKGGRILD